MSPKPESSWRKEQGCFRFCFYLLAGGSLIGCFRGEKLRKNWGGGRGWDSNGEGSEPGKQGDFKEWETVSKKKDNIVATLKRNQ